MKTYVLDVLENVLNEEKANQYYSEPLTTEVARFLSTI